MNKKIVVYVIVILIVIIVAFYFFSLPKNNSQIQGDEVVQLYVHRLNSQIEWPEKELKGFSRVSLKAGESKRITLTLHVSQLRYWDTKIHDWRLENGTIQIMIGSSSSDIRVVKSIDI